ncbi:hypothetical protein CAPTEDRAFT_125923 [Capitella teleta]|uniref:F-box domain-containing protein n=1 Tax=Capitella teleta TaxID=283909 RepID=R7TCR2_CAPTE|nr:hypothetical protein CAPTEDRAFT_125923 [Capitella teleta]|eukprot:ELT89252.1 hypothetical protein CAPTEDRAFT_125923 [Capitella teleta]
MIDWTCLPEHVLINIFTPLDMRDRNAAAQACDSWREAVLSPYLWRHYNFKLHVGSRTSNHRFLMCIMRYGSYMRDVSVEIDQGHAGLCHMGIVTMERFAALRNRKLRLFRVSFIGDNDMYFSDEEYVETLCLLFKSSIHSRSLEVVDLSELWVTYRDRLIDTLSKFNTELTELRIDSRQQQCKVSPLCIKRLIKRCRNLHTLHLYECNLTDRTLLKFTEDNHVPLKRLSITCHHEGKYRFASETWMTLARSNPDLKVILKFQHDCQTEHVLEMIQMGMPVTEVHFMTFTYIYAEVNWVTECLKETLRVFKLRTPLARNAPQLHIALLKMADQCKRLDEMHVTCDLDKITVDRILELCPNMKKSGKYTLRY